MRKRELIILIAALILGLIVFISLFILSDSKQSTHQQTPVQKPSASVTINNLPRPSISPSPSPIIAANVNELIYQLPFQSDLFDIEYLSRSNRFVITVNQNPYEQNLELGKKWFRDRGINPDELEVYYNTGPGVFR